MWRLAGRALSAAHIDAVPLHDLEEPFTQLRDLHEAVAGESLLRDNFRGQMEPQLACAGLMSDGAHGRLSRLWRHRD